MANVQIMYCLSSRNPVKLTNRRVNYLFWLVIFSSTTWEAENPCLCFHHFMPMFL